MAGTPDPSGTIDERPQAMRYASILNQGNVTTMPLTVPPLLDEADWAQVDHYHGVLLGPLDRKGVL